MPTTTVQGEAWITRADMAALMRKSEDTVRRAEKKHQLETREDDAGRVRVNVGDLVRIGLLHPGDLTAGATPADPAEVLRARETVTALKTQVAELTGRLAHSDLVRDTLREQLAVRDKQIAQQANQLTQLIARIRGSKTRVTRRSSGARTVGRCSSRPKEPTRRP
jgi:uncharacterized coiled-coil protein SlyX